MTARKALISLVTLCLVAIIALYVFNAPFSSEQAYSTIESQENQQLTIGDTHYLFDVSDNNPTEIKALLDRAEKISETAKSNHSQSKIVMVIHGPDVVLFDKKNYKQNKSLIDQAARLDAFDVIDFKVCLVSANSRGINQTSFPAFIEVVPFASTEVSQLKDKGFVEL